MKYAMNLEKHTSADYDTKATLLQNYIYHVKVYTQLTWMTSPAFDTKSTLLLHPSLLPYLDKTTFYPI